jgi:dipeptidyl aminopeptidase/acylaminoacyl peptidase
LAFTVNRAGVSDLYLLDAAGQRAQPTLPPWSIVKGLRFSPDGSQIGFTLQSPTAPADVYSLAVKDSSNNRLQRWTYSVVGGLNPQSFTLPTLETIPSFDGQQVAAFQYRPAAASPTNPVPVVISLHGGPESQYHPYFSPHIQYLVGQQGYAVLCPNVRGSTGYGKTFTSLDDGPRREDSVRDIGAILDWIAKQPELDAKRVVVRGRSYGGYLVLASLARYGDRLCAGVDVAGLTDFQSFLKHTEAYRRARRRIEYGDERDPSTQVFFERIAPINNIKQIRSPLLVVHGANDPRVPFREATRLVERLSALDRDIWAVFVHDEGHQLSKHLNVNYALGVETMFLNRQFEKKDPSPSSLQRTAAEHPSTKSESGS